MRLPIDLALCELEEIFFEILDAFASGLHDIIVLETEIATFECQLLDDSLEGERVWWYKGQKVEASTDKYEKLLISLNFGESQ